MVSQSFLCLQHPFQSTSEEILNELDRPSQDRPSPLNHNGSLDEFRVSNREKHHTSDAAIRTIM